MKNKKDELIQNKLEGLFKKLQWSECLVPYISRVLFESNFYNTCLLYLEPFKTGELNLIVLEQRYNFS